MPKRPTKNKTMLAAELPAELVARFRDYARARGERIGAVLERAITREMAYPPPLATPEPPLPFGEPGEPKPAPKRRARK